MPLSQAQKDQLVADCQTVSNDVAALVVDTVDVTALQQQLATAQQQVTDLTSQLADANTAKDAAVQVADAATAARDSLQAKITAALSKLADAKAADQIEDQAHADAVTALS